MKITIVNEHGRCLLRCDTCSAGTYSMDVSRGELWGLLGRLIWFLFVKGLD